MANIQPIDKNVHANLKLKNNDNFIQSANSHVVPVVVHEFGVASQEFPIVFIKDQNTGQFRAIALLGLKPEENLFFDVKGWKGDYAPESLHCFPFLASQTESGSNNVILCADLDSELLNEADGESFFNDSGEQNNWLAEKANRVVSLVEKNKLTQEFIRTLLDNDLLVSQSLNIKLEGEEKFTINGLYVIDESKLNALSGDDYLTLKNKGFIAPIYASLFSMQRINRLAKLHLKK